MKFSVGLLDSLFDKKMKMEIQDQDCNVKYKMVTEKWYDLIVEQKRLVM
ncbi:hypothetical protein [Gottfriedia acidiceleris]|uniref:Uncharacterized protein n=1 Tax=Gottfriedia acidiceleris TaxID=371036 RepID=A0ABY4JTE5_9BACI|nr:hypothetical protein [Gottfriedia acidiceleris]UPM56365.1 hypothetical protein MY490_11230 [Gottfriedia acidiceleris]